MNILIDIGHPAHVHLYRYFYFEAKDLGHKLFVTVKDLPAAKRLLESYGIPYIVLGTRGISRTGKLFQQVWFDILTYWIVVRKRIDIGLGSSITITHVSTVTRMKSIVFDDDDDDVQPLFVKFAHPFATSLLSPDVLKGKRKRKDTIYYPSYHELSYLHPSRFKPDPGVLSRAGIKEGEVFFIMRFNQFTAHHDYNVTGLTLHQKEELLNELLPFGRVFISTESETDKVFDKYRISIDPSEIHSFLYYAKLFVGDSQTMTSEAAVLGTPAIRCNTLAGSLSYLNEQEIRYGLCFGYKPEEFNMIIDKIGELLSNPMLDEEWKLKKDIMIKDKIDLTDFMLWYVLNYPSSDACRTQPSLFRR